jgi:hypothetical protein
VALQGPSMTPVKLAAVGHHQKRLEIRIARRCTIIRRRGQKMVFV